MFYRPFSAGRGLRFFHGISRAPVKLTTPYSAHAARFVSSSTEVPIPDKPQSSKLIDVSVETANGNEALVDAASQLGWMPTDMIMYSIENLHLSWQIPYWEAIVLTTLAFRVCLMPISIKTAQGSARMAAVRPLLTKISDAMKKDANAGSMAKKKAYADQSKALMKQYKVNPFVSLMMPIVQLPIFMSFFFALQGMGEHFPAMQTGGILWFTDLTAPDSYMILPAANALSFLLMIEIGADGLATGDQGNFKWVMRGLAFMMTPLTMSMPQGLFIYWTTNNAVSVLQAIIMKVPTVRSFLDMPAPPKASKSRAMGNIETASNPFKIAMDTVKKEFSHHESSTAEIVDGVQKKVNVVNSGPAPVTFDRRPKKNKGKKN